MAVRKISGRWCVDIRYHGKRLRKRCPDSTREAAVRYERFWHKKLADHGSFKDVMKELNPTQTMPTFAAFSDRWFHEYALVNNKPSEQRSKSYSLRIHLVPAFGKRLLDEITTLDIETYKRRKQTEGLSAKTINNHLTILRKCLATAVDWEISKNIPRFKFLKTTLPVIDFLEVEEVKRLIEIPPPDRWRTMIRLAVRSGLRFSELAALTWKDVDLTRAHVCVRRACVMGHMGTPKNGRIRHVPLTLDLQHELRALPHDAEFVFHLQGKPVPYEYASWKLTLACRAAGIKEIRWHALRHTFASHLVQRGGSLKAIQDLLGHATISMTLRYAHLAAHALHETIALLEDLPSKDSDEDGHQLGTNPSSA